MFCPVSYNFSLLSNHSSYLRKVFPTPGLPEQNRVAFPNSSLPSRHRRNSSVCKNHSPIPSCRRPLTSLWRTRGCRGDNQFKSSALSFTYVTLVMVLWLLIGLKLFIWPVPVEFGPRCVEGFILLHCVGVVKVAKATEFLDRMLKPKLRESGVVVTYLQIDSWWPPFQPCHQPIIAKTTILATDVMVPNHPSNLHQKFTVSKESFPLRPRLFSLRESTENEGPLIQQGPQIP